MRDTFRLRILTAGATALVACGPALTPVQPNPTPRAVPDRRVSARPAPRPATKMQRALLKLVRELQSQKSRVVPVIKLIAKHIPGFEDDEGKDFPENACIRVLPVRKGTLLGAFVEVAAKDGKRCPEDSEREGTVYWLSVHKDNNKDRLAFTWVDTEIFNGREVAVKIPRGIGRVRIFVVTYQSASDSDESGGGSSGKRRVAEIFQRSDRRFTRRDTLELSSGNDVPGKSATSATTLKWITTADKKTVYLAAVSKSVVTYFNTTAGSNESSTHCERTISLYAATAAGDWKEIPDKSLPALKKRIPALSKLPAPAGAKTAKACKAL